MSDGQIDLTVSNFVAELKINRPAKMNSITRDMGIELNRLAVDINNNKNIRVVVLCGEGEKSFSTGSDLKMFDQYGGPFDLRKRQDYCMAVRSIGKPVISKVKGYALGGGFEMMLATDIRIVSETAKFCVSEIKNGWIPGSGLLQVLSRDIGYHKAAELAFTAKMIDAAEAMDYGFVNRVLPAADIDEAVSAMAQEMAGFSPVAMELAKTDLRASQNMFMDQGLTFEKDLAAFSMSSNDSKEGMAAFMEKRPPRFKGN